jgi:hypothetical protein
VPLPRPTPPDCVSVPLSGGLFLPVRCGGSRRLLAPARGAPRLRRPRPGSASRGGAPRCPQTTASPTPRPGSARREPRGLRRHGCPTRQAESFPRPKGAAICSGGGYSIRRCRGWPVTPEPAGTPRAHRWRETLAPTETLFRARGTARDPTARRAAGSRAEEPAGAGRWGAQARRWTPWQRQNKRASRSETKKSRPAGQNKPPRSGKRDQEPCNRRFARMTGNPAERIRLRAASTL